MHIAVLGAGAWGTALAISLSQKHELVLWSRDPVDAAKLNTARTNQRYLAGVMFPAALKIDADFFSAITHADLALIATPTSGLAATAEAVFAQRPQLPIIWACKGFDRSTGRLPHETITQVVGNSNTLYGALTGPSFALEIARGLPAALTLACNDFDFAQRTAAILNGGNLRVYSNADLIGVELGGALKNVMAIAAGLCDGLELGMNARAAIITRGLAEMVRLGVAMGGKAETFMGLTGLGDLILTATGSLSRNRSVGVGLAAGKSLDAILAELGHVAEGVNSAETALQLADKHNVDMPITAAVCALLFQHAEPREIVKQLLSRETRAE